MPADRPPHVLPPGAVSTPAPGRPPAQRSPVRRLLAPRILALAVLTWTLVSWGGRIGLLGRGDVTDSGDLLRIGGSLLVGWVTGGVLWWAPERLREVRWFFVVWTVVLWGRSLVVVWVDFPSLPFVVVHTVLALSWFGLAWAVAPARPDPTGAGPT